MTNRGFTLVEVITAILVMSMMMVAVVGFVEYSANIWRKGNIKINAKNYTRLTFDYLKQDLNRAQKVSAPDADGVPANALFYEFGGKAYGVRASGDVLQRESYANPLVKSVAAKEILARKVEKFLVTRVSTWTLHIHLSIYDDTETDDTGDPTIKQIISSETMTITVPGLS